MKYLKALYGSLRAILFAALASGTVGSVHPQDTVDPETAAWNRAVQENTVDAYQRYLALYPLGAHAAAAFEATVELLLAAEAPLDAADEGLPGLDMY
jgi:hypothetical protein